LWQLWSLLLMLLLLLLLPVVVAVCERPMVVCFWLAESFYSSQLKKSINVHSHENSRCKFTLALSMQTPPFARIFNTGCCPFGCRCLPCYTFHACPQGVAKAVNRDPYKTPSLSLFFRGLYYTFYTFTTFLEEDRKYKRENKNTFNPQRRGPPQKVVKGVTSSKECVLRVPSSHCATSKKTNHFARLRGHRL
jgi:hypothetical protein